MGIGVLHAFMFFFNDPVVWDGDAISKYVHILRSSSPPQKRPKEEMVETDSWEGSSVTILKIMGNDTNCNPYG